MSSAAAAPPRKRLGIYLADQDWQQTLSKGIYRYSRSLAHALTRRAADLDLYLLVSKVNRADMVPPGFPPSRAKTLPVARASGLARLLADHLLAPLYARRLRLDVLHFPKGFVPLWRPAGTLYTATLHDTIPLYYQDRYPGYFPSAKLTYLRTMILGSLRRCRAVMSDSLFSRHELQALAEERSSGCPAIEVCPLTPDPEAFPRRRALPEAKAKVFFHFGSLLPHKRTLDTIRLFRGFNARQGHRWRLRVSGLQEAPVEWGLASANDVQFLGAIGDAQLANELAEARLVLLLSEVEGFGLPALEAWRSGTPVCYSRAAALAEILAGIPGRCDAWTDDSFAPAVLGLLALSADEIDRLQGELGRRFSEDVFSDGVARFFGRVLGTPRADY